MQSDQVSPPDHPSARVAVVVRTKDRPQFLGRALANIDQQTFTDYHVVVVNDAGDPEPVDAVLAQAPAGIQRRTTVLHRSTSTGMEAAANAGLLASDSEFCCIHDDDLWEPEFLARTVGFLDAHPETEMVVVRIQIRFEEEVEGTFVETGRKDFWTHLPTITIQELVWVNRMVPIGVLYRRRLHEEVGLYNEALPVVGDWDFNLRVAARHPIGIVDERLALWCQRPSASGASANSINAPLMHAKYDMEVRAAAIRDEISRGGSLGPYLFGAFLAAELVEHGERARAEMARHFDDLRQDITRQIDARFDQLTGDLHSRMDELERYVANRTNPLYLVKRGFAMIFRGGPPPEK
ncbi:MAG: glycosyltransferase family A protein [Brooklawnia sp.]|uniref:glycosyltransferase family 2 protein n=1 Tax=Brooklawnia sp. TaxID=2699740 RepID=UPI003C709AED